MYDASGRITNLALTYANNRYIDGAGAQLQRIYAIYALSRFLDISYVHSPIAELGYHGLSALERNEGIPELTARYNEAFHITSNTKVPEHYVTHSFIRTDLDFLCGLKNKIKESNEFHLVQLIFPDSLAEHHVQCLRYIKEISYFNRPVSSLFRIAIHVRRGDLFVAESERMLPNSYYITIALQAIEVLNKLGIPFSCELYTELPSKKFVVTPEHHGFRNFVVPENGSSIGNRIQNEVLVDPAASCIEEFDVLPHLKKCINTDPIQSMQALATADLLIISRSAFSYVPALLNKQGTVIYHPFWHAPLPEWIDANNKNSFLEQLTQNCKRWKAEQMKII